MIVGPDNLQHVLAVRDRHEFYCFSEILMSRSYWEKFEGMWMLLSDKKAQVQCAMMQREYISAV